MEETPKAQEGREPFDVAKGCGRWVLWTAQESRVEGSGEKALKIGLIKCLDMKSVCQGTLQVLAPCGGRGTESKGDSTSARMKPSDP